MLSLLFWHYADDGAGYRPGVKRKGHRKADDSSSVYVSCHSAAVHIASSRHISGDAAAVYVSSRAHTADHGAAVNISAAADIASDIITVHITACFDRRAYNCLQQKHYRKQCRMTHHSSSTRSMLRHGIQAELFWPGVLFLPLQTKAASARGTSRHAVCCHPPKVRLSGMRLRLDTLLQKRCPVHL